MNKHYFFSHGKLLLTSEYFVLDGSKSLSLPTKLGQELFVEIVEYKKSYIYWETYRENVLWLKAYIDYKTLKIIETNKEDASEFILKIFTALKELQSHRLEYAISYTLKSNIQFPENYGLGSSSTLINNIAEWGGVDPFHLNDLVLGGSGYDIAIAKEGSPVLYTRKENEKIIEAIDYKPMFSDQLLFVHLNKKQDSREGIEMYRRKKKSQYLIDFFTSLTCEVLNCSNLESFSDLMEEHEKVISDFLKIQMVKEKYFKNIPSFFKSLGAWGGDFILTTKFRDYENYFFHNGFPNFFSYEEIIY